MASFLKRQRAALAIRTGRSHDYGVMSMEIMTHEVSSLAQCLLDGGDDAALDGERTAWDARSGRCRMAAAAELRGDFVYVHSIAFRSQTDPSQFRFEFFEDTCHHDRRNGADVVYEALGIAALGAGAGEGGLFEPVIGDLILVRQPEVAVEMLEQPDARQRVGLINLVADFGEVGSAANKFASDMVTAGLRARVLKRASIGRDSGEQAVGDPFGDGPLGGLEQPEDEFAAGGFAGRDPVDIGVARVALVMIYVDEEFSAPDARADFSQALEAGRIGGDHAVERLAPPGFLEEFVLVEKLVFPGIGILVPADDPLALVLEGQGQAELRSDTVAIRTYMADDANGAAVTDAFDDPVNYLRMALHSIVRDLPPRVP